MKIKILFILFFLASFNSVAQNTYSTEVTYQEDLNFDLPVNSISKLSFNNSKSYYTKGLENDTIVKKAEYKNKGIKVIEYGNADNTVIKTDLKNKIILRKVKLSDGVFLVKEDLADINWEINEKSIDTILSYKCLKATGMFRGRLYTVWFTREIPVPFGPWKLNGLPGLILQAKDSLNQVAFTAYKIKHLKKNKTFNYIFPSKDHDYKTISLKEYIPKLEDYKKSKVQAIISKFPRGSIKNLKYNEKRGGLELKYEWEDK